MKYGLILLLLFSVFAVSAQKDMEAGKNIFKSRCASCHNIAQKVVGPALKDVSKRRSETWIISFVHSSQEMIKKGDSAAVAVFNEMNQSVMPDHKDLKDDDVRNIIAYVNDESEKLAAKASQAPFPRPEEVKTDHHVPVNIRQYWVFATLGVFIFSLVLILNTIINANTLMAKTPGTPD